MVRGGPYGTLQTRTSGLFACLVCENFLTPLRTRKHYKHHPHPPEQHTTRVCELFAVDHVVHRKHAQVVCLRAWFVSTSSCHSERANTTNIIPILPNFAKEHGLRAVGGDVVYTVPPAFASVHGVHHALLSLLFASGVVRFAHGDFTNKPHHSTWFC